MRGSIYLCTLPLIILKSFFIAFWNSLNYSAVIFVMSQNGKAAPNNEIGRSLMEVVGAVPQMDPSQLEKMLNCNMQVTTFIVMFLL